MIGFYIPGCGCGECRAAKFDGLKPQKATLVDYLKMKVELEDWHAVSDAANDLRELEVRIKCQDQTQTPTSG